MSLTNSDRRRFFLATSLTLLALPALWWANRSEESAAPNVAVAGAGVGVDVGDHGSGDPTSDPSTENVAAVQPAPTDGSAGATDPATPPTTVAVPSTTAPPAADEGTTDDDLGAIAPVFLEGPSARVGAGLSEIAVPAPPAIARVTTTATFRNDIGSRDTCVVPGLLDAGTVTIVNLDNGHNVTCATSFTPGTLGDEIVMSRHAFSQLADLTDAPIPVEIRR